MLYKPIVKIMQDIRTIRDHYEGTELDWRYDVEQVF